MNGFTDVANLTGGYRTWKAATAELEILGRSEGKGDRPPAFDRAITVQADDGSPRKPQGGKEISIDACGLQCPGPIIRLKKEIDAISTGDILTIRATDPGFAHDVKSWCSLTGNSLVSLETVDGVIAAVIEKGTKGSPEKTEAGMNAARCGGTGATFIVFSNDMDRALASFVLANGAAATGKNVTMFFTFWGLSVLRKKARGVKKDLLGRMFGMMLPKSMKGLSLSSMNFGGLGPVMMKYRMKTKNVDQLESMFAEAQKSGVRMIACQMSMDIMGINAAELLDGVEIGGVATYMEAASASGVNLFI
jgi:peroxiredoxin family protein/TusA-related sulfurtransferase